ncbi:DNA-binding response regulator [Stenotrophomonas sp. Betaine-02u-21]|uniref:winged helix-turn-helix domain-containing protein n=1 Tax=unclassified Stenotrophomonas TaxID=196198 RepID=UPI000C33B39D|nr:MULTISPECIES: response regulator transcription factor [unclassified Stenotrophomonas]PKH74048.1 DNA-binding response regulator [Stenotrophomonas sp. Betaine-02u-21]PKH76499.1 DNA-binding response regulator [Stenotrophomonas sp. Betaine-02u-23]PKH94246.1 DNA-binding response regulator [Stenotrophomonas sp. Bg11-02]
MAVLERPLIARPRILLVEDDEAIAGLTARFLQNHGLECHIAAGVAAAEQCLSRGMVDLILLDLGLPDGDGLTMLRGQSCQIPVIIVTGRGDSVDRVVGLELGADDYVAKPFDYRELLARIHSVLRRAQRPSTSARDVFRFDGILLNASERVVLDRNGNAVRLTSAEFDLLHALVQGAGTVLSRDQLMNSLHGRDAGPFDRAIDVHIGRLRRKLERDPSQPQLIQATRGVGYRLAASVSP